jgi:hypothetical protein
MSSSSDSESRKIRRPHKRSSHRDKKTRSISRRRSSESSTSTYSSSSLDKRSRKKRKRKKRKELKKREKHERRQRYTGDVDSDDSSSSDERGRKGKKSRRSKKRRKKDSEAKVNSASSSTAHDETIEVTHSDDKGAEIVDHATGVTANAPQTAESNHASNSTLTAKPTKSKGPMTQQQYLEIQSQIREVIDPHTGRTRWMRGTGEIVERIVSKEEHSRLNQCATLGDGRGFARDIARVAAMKRNGS